MTRSLFDPVPRSPVLTPEALRALGERILSMTAADTVRVQLSHRATGTARVANGEVQINDSGDRLFLWILMQFGQRLGMALATSQIDTASLRQAVAYLERNARELPGDAVQTAMPIPPRHYLTNTTSHDSTLAAFYEQRHEVIETLVAPVAAAGLITSAFSGVMVQSRLYADKQGLMVAGQETDSEITVTAWNPDGKGSGWAGDAAREWTTLRPEEVSAEAIRLTTLSRNPVALEPGRRLTILARPAVAQIVARMGDALSARLALGGNGPLYDRHAGRVRLGQRIVDARVALSSDPNDPDGGYLPFNDDGFPLVPMTWVSAGGTLANLAYDTYYAAECGVTPANDPPASLRMSGGTSTVEQMIENCQEGIYVNRVAQLSSADWATGTISGVTNGGCFLIRNGHIDKPIRDLRFVESPWLFLNRLEAMGSSQRTAFGYAPWNGSWPIAPTIVPPLMIRDFNFTALASAV